MKVIDYKNLGKRIRNKRLDMDMTQEVLAELVDISAPHMSNIERGTAQVSLLRIVNIANVLHTSIDQLLCDSIDQSETIYRDELNTITKSCNVKELRLIVDTILTIKQSLETYNKTS